MNLFVLIVLVATAFTKVDIYSFDMALTLIRSCI